MRRDVLIAKPTKIDTQAVTVNAPPEDFGFLDRPSATGILPEFQQLAIGDKIFFGREELTVAVLEPPGALALSDHAHGIECVWQFGLYPLADQRTRLVSRGTERVPRAIVSCIGMRLMDPRRSS
jgi:hypothetical protein